MVGIVKCSIIIFFIKLNGLFPIYLIYKQNFGIINLLLYNNIIYNIYIISIIILLDHKRYTNIQHILNNVHILFILFINIL